MVGAASENSSNSIYTNGVMMGWLCAICCGEGFAMSLPKKKIIILCLSPQSRLRLIGRDGEDYNFYAYIRTSLCFSSCSFLLDQKTCSQSCNHGNAWR